MFYDLTSRQLYNSYKEKCNSKWISKMARHYEKFITNKFNYFEKYYKRENSGAIYSSLTRNCLDEK